ncbi:MAG TPA: DUF2938 domain-containing protein [Burkholderiales bacterium]|nr:DUF2938 domain-containing protein [Burkholderiales bacterium]
MTAASFVAGAAMVGIGATAFMDAVAAGRRTLFATPAPDYGLVGRWIAWMPRGRFVHEAIARTPAVAGERAIGWTVHYLVGIAFAALLLAWQGPQWACRPTLWPALMVGVASVAAPLLLMQPGMGAGIASRRAPNPNSARLRSVVNHAIFGLGLYVGGWAAGAIACA